MSEEDIDEKPAKVVSPKRGYIIKEMIATEETYVKKLQFILSIFMVPLQQQKVLDDETLKYQFGSVPLILEKHQQLYESLSNVDYEKVGLLFKEFSEELHVYEEYMVNFDPALTKRAALLMSNRKFANFVEAARSDPDAAGLGIESFLIAPVQRIPRYRLLLQELIKYTDFEHPDYQNLHDAFEAVGSSASAHNEAIRRRETKDKLMVIMMQFDNRSRVNLLDGIERSIVKEGVLGKQCRRGIKDFTFWIFSDCILYGEQQIPGVGYYNSSRLIQLTKCRVSPARNIANADDAFIIESTEKSFIVWAKSKDRDEWVSTLSTAMEARQAEVEEETGNIAPVWTPDNDCLQCETCEAKFTMILRRHHCRNCGAIVCDSCSKKRFLVEHIHQTKEQRVCDLCYDDLSTPDGAARVSEKGAGDVPGAPKTNLPKRGRQSVILRGIEAETIQTAAGVGPATRTNEPSPGKTDDSRAGKASLLSSMFSSGASAKEKKARHKTLKKHVSCKEFEVRREDGTINIENPVIVYLKSVAAAASAATDPAEQAPPPHTNTNGIASVPTVDGPPSDLPPPLPKYPPPAVRPSITLPPKPSLPNTPVPLAVQS
mgnify:CR=1 FL=1